MPSSAKIEIVCVPPDMIGPMWAHIGPHLLKGQLEIMRGDLRAAMAALTIVIVAAQAGEKHLWAVIDDESKAVLAAMISEIREEDGRRIVWVTGMGGEHIMRWGKAMSDRMAEFAKAEGCEAYRFHGRKALLRAYRNVRIIGNHDAGVHLFERAVS